MTDVPTFDAMMNPTLEALKQLGGSGTIEEIYHTVADIMALSDEQLEQLHNPDRSSQTEVEYHVIFQCKRYRGSVGSNHVRDFRGAMVGRADKGLLITTGNFTREAQREATRDGAPAIDLIDGNLLAEKLKELELGVTTKTVVSEKVEVDSDWFLSMRQVL